jgi:hypothetical protein
MPAWSAHRQRHERIPMKRLSTRAVEFVAKGALGHGRWAA